MNDASEIHILNDFFRIVMTGKSKLRNDLLCYSAHVFYVSSLKQSHN